MQPSAFYLNHGAHLDTKITDDDYNYIDVVIPTGDHQYEELRRTPHPSGMVSLDLKSSRRSQKAATVQSDPGAHNNKSCRRPPWWGWALLVTVIVIAATLVAILVVLLTSTTSTATTPTTSLITTTTGHPTTRTTAATPTNTPIPSNNPPIPTEKDCQEVYANDGTNSGVYTISIDGTHAVQVYCEQELQGGGWTVFQQRMDGSVDFYLGWQKYKEGFGSAAGEYWLGNDHIHTLTANKDTQLLVELHKGDETAHVHYSTFWIEDERNKYRFHRGSFTNGTNGAGDGFAIEHSLSYFSTPDRDNDQRSDLNCAVYGKSAWWYKSCKLCDLNAIYGDRYYYWGGGAGWSSYLTGSRMMIKK